MAADATASPEGGGVLQSIAHLGVLPAGMEWAAARGVIQARLAEALASFAADPAAQEGPAPMEEDAPWVEPELTREELCERLEQFAGPPFTIQRLCELLLEPPRHYSTRGKFAYACGKLLTVTDLIRLEADPLSAAMQAEVAERKAAVVAKDEEYRRRKAEDEAAAAAAAAAGEDGPEAEAAAAAAAEVAAEEKWMAANAAGAAGAAVGGDPLAAASAAAASSECMGGAAAEAATAAAAASDPTSAAATAEAVGAAIASAASADINGGGGGGGAGAESSMELSS